MKPFKTDIIPKSPTIIDIGGSHELDLKAICVFLATGFFLDTDTYWKDKKVLQPGSMHSINASGKWLGSKPYFEWHHTPRNIGFEEALDEFQVLFEQIVEEQTQDKKVILPLSGGLDSRTQAVALRNHPKVKSYSYEFNNGYPEGRIGQEIADTLEIPFKRYKIRSGYLWHCIEALADINQCYSEFTHPRQMFCIKDISRMGDVFSLGHMGDLLFDSMGLPQLKFKEEVDLVLKKFLKKGGRELAIALWQTWDLEGDFDTYIRERISELLSQIKITDTNAKLRAFKAMYSVTRWSSNNLSIFQSVAPIELPYYDNRMYDFICSLPENYLSGRQLQIEYIKRCAPELAKITWQAHKPYNLYTYKQNKTPNNLPYRFIGKSQRIVNGLIGKPYIARNWELQFLGKPNDVQLKRWLFEEGLDNFIPKEIIDRFYKLFKEKDAITYAHSTSMLLTLSLFNKKFNY